MADHEPVRQPVPKPRRLHHTPTAYENVSLDAINKNIILNSDNLHQTTLKAKVPNNKQFMSTTTSDSQQQSPPNYRNVITEINNLNLDKPDKNSSNKNFADSHKLKNMPVAAPRRMADAGTPSNNNEIYENNPESQLAAQEIYESNEDPPMSQNSSASASSSLSVTPMPTSTPTGAIRKAHRKPPQLPLPPPPTITPPKQNNQQITSSGVLVDDYSEDVGVKHKLEKSVSNGSLSSSTSGGSSGAKFNTNSPGALLKALGSTSRQLTEAISERVAVRTKGAIHKLDKIQQNSGDLFSDTTKTASTRLLSVGKSLHQSSLDRLKYTKRSLQNVRQSIGMKIIGDNMSLDRKAKSAKGEGIPEEYDLDQPTNNDAFKSISFQSQLKSRETTSSYDMSDASYEVPRSQSIPEGLEAPPSYKELYKTLPEDDEPLFNRNSTVTQSAGFMGYRRSENIPYPKFPPPILGPQKKENRTLSTDSNYTEMSPVRNTPRRKDYEETQIRFKIKPPEIASNRATADPNEYVQLDPSQDRLESCFSRNVISADLSEAARLDEQNLPSPSRSESWAFYDATTTSTQDDADSNSSPEPIYENNDSALAEEEGEAIYGAVYSLKESPGGTLLTPVAVPRKKHSSKIIANSEKESSNEILKEFDPMDWSAVDQMFSSKSNELILLESLLAEDTYGTLANVSSVDMTDEEDSDGPTVIASPSQSNLAEPPPEPTKLIEEERKSIIIHQNLKLHAFDLVDEDAAVAPFLAQVDPKPSSSQNTNWFVDTQISDSSPTMKDAKPAGIAPPPYTESPPEISPSDDKRSNNKFTSIFSVFNKRKNSFNKTLSPTTEKTKPDLNPTIEMLPRPSLTQRLILHEGTIIRLPSKAVDDILKEQHRAMAFIRDRRFQVYTDKEMKSPKENIPLENIVAIQCVSQHKFTNNSIELHCFEITTVTPKNSDPSATISPHKPGQLLRTTHLYGVAKESDRFIWMQKLLEGITDVFQTGHTCRYYRAGWCYLKNSITSQWSGAWITLHKHKKRLICYTTNDMNLEVLDLRKARCLILKESDESVVNLPVEQGPLLMVDCPPYSMYMAMCSARETKIWRHIIMEVAHNNGPSIKEQQLTKGDVSVLVDKCVNFVYTHGSMSEGIYRKSGSENAIQRLLQLFRADAFSVQLTRSEYTEHDVANALKRFMRDLPESMLGRHAASFVSVAAMQSPKDKLKAYKELLSRLPVIEYQTLRKLIGHLNFIQSQAPRNKMHVENLSIVWGPTLLEDRHNLNEMQFSQMESQVIVDLVQMYKHLYQLTPDEVSKEKTMLAVLQKYHAAAENLSDSVKHSGDLKVWITIDGNPDNELEEKTQVNVTLTPTKTVYDICKELAPRIKREPISVTLNEYILDGNLHRPMHHSEKVFDVVLKWSYWPEADRKNNCLRLQPTKLIKNVVRALRNLPIVSPSKELKFADNRTKVLRSMQLELVDARITVMKKEKGNSMVGVRELDLRTMTTYLGSEKKRDCQQRWALTLVENEMMTGGKCVLRTRESPFFGHIIAGSDSNDSLVWFSSIMHGLYGDDLLPEAEIIIT